MVSLSAWTTSTDELRRVGVRLPSEQSIEARGLGAAQPSWIHMGGGNLYRSLHAQIAQDLIEAGELDRGIVVAQTRSPITVDRLYRAHNCDILQVLMHGDGTLDQRILASTARAVFAHPDDARGWGLMKSYFESDVLQLVTFTITEKGYVVAEGDIDLGPASPQGCIPITCALLLARFHVGASPLALVSTDNFSQNGARLRDAVLRVASTWVRKGFAPEEFYGYVSDEGRVAFPYTMVDRIAPNPSPKIEAALTEMGWSDLDSCTDGTSRFAAFANAEPTFHLVIEDRFPNGRPALERAGAIRPDRETAELCDTMKVTCCLNPVHTALALFGCLLGHETIADTMRDPSLASLARRVAYDEGLPVVSHPGVLDPGQFIDQLLTERLPNASLPDTPQRIATDTSQKMPIRFGRTISRHAGAPYNDAASLTAIPLVIAGWLRYLIGVDDAGRQFTPSPDPLLEELTAKLEDLHLGCETAELVHRAAAPILRDERIFGVDLHKVGLEARIEALLQQMLARPGAVACTLETLAR